MKRLQLLLAFSASQAMAISGFSQDVSFYGVIKQQRYEQSTAGAPTPQSTPFRFNVNVDTQLGGVSGGSVKLPGGSVQALQPDGGESWRVKADYLTQAGLDADYPNGAYQLTLNTVHDGTKTIPLNLTGNAYPNIPQVVNFAAAKTVDATAAFTVTWSPFTGGTANDYVQFMVEDDSGHALFQSPGPGVPGSLNGTSVAGTIPANALPSGGKYTANVLFARIVAVDLTSYGQGVTGVAAYTSETRFKIATLAGPDGPDVKFYGVAKGVHFEQTSAGDPVATNPGYGFNSFVDCVPHGVKNATLKLPSGTTQGLAASDVSSWNLESAFPTKAALDATYPNGTYALTLSTAHDGTPTGTVNLTGDRYPKAPKLENFTAAQAVDPSAAFVVRWNPFFGGTVNDFIQLSLDDDTGNTVFETPAYGQTGSLNGTSTSFTFPAGTLKPGLSYQGRLTFAALAGADLTSYGQGVIGVAAYLAETTFTMVTTGTAVADVANYSLFKLQLFAQTDTGAPVPEGANPYRFIVNVVPLSAGLLNSAGLQLPGGSGQAILPTDDPLFWTLRQSFNSAAALDAAYPAGDYLFSFDTKDDGFRSPSVNVPLTGYPPVVPHIKNFAAAQAVDAAADFTVAWDAMAGATVDDAILLNVFDDLGNTVFPPDNDPNAGFFDNSVTSATIKGGTLRSGTTYQAQLLFRRRTTLDTSSYPGATGVVQGRKRTDFTLTTLAAAAPTLTLTQVGPSQFKLHATGNIGQNYLIENADSLAPTINWQPMVNFVGSAAGFDFTDGVVRARNFYRVRPAN